MATHSEEVHGDTTIPPVFKAEANQVKSVCDLSSRLEFTNPYSLIVHAVPPYLTYNFA